MKLTLLKHLPALSSLQLSDHLGANKIAYNNHSIALIKDVGTALSVLSISNNLMTDKITVCETDHANDLN